MRPAAAQRGLDALVTQARFEMRRRRDRLHLRPVDDRVRRHYPPLVSRNPLRHLVEGEIAIPLRLWVIGIAHEQPIAPPPRQTPVQFPGRVAVPVRVHMIEVERPIVEERQGRLVAGDAARLGQRETAFEVVGEVGRNVPERQLGAV
jgi:hypothetical protein